VQRLNKLTAELTETAAANHDLTAQVEALEEELAGAARPCGR
jgi:cell division septum initiation protein DivIVA